MKKILYLVSIMLLGHSCKPRENVAYINLEQYFFDRVSESNVESIRSTIDDTQSDLDKDIVLMYLGAQGIGISKSDSIKLVSYRQMVKEANLWQDSIAIMLRMLDIQENRNRTVSKNSTGDFTLIGLDKYGEFGSSLALIQHFDSSNVKVVIRAYEDSVLVVNKELGYNKNSTWGIENLPEIFDFNDANYYADIYVKQGDQWTQMSVCDLSSLIFEWKSDKEQKNDHKLKRMLMNK